ncbi:hypothetical protein [Streptomyces sp. SM12]|uniref:hypothetical protein n=1 Tax=Streptomyces sp. SM12 TaxID=1071602 RepID=UPI000CD558C0|nr:hypothetical protein [Streptomyces sp. SM12]
MSGIARTATATVPSEQLIGYVAGLLPLADWHLASQLAASVATAAASTAPLTPTVDSVSGLPADVAAAARAAAREHASTPWRLADAMFVRAARPADRLLVDVLTQLHATDGPPPVNPPLLHAA